jgi:hypothetical protein
MEGNVPLKTKKIYSTSFMWFPKIFSLLWHAAVSSKGILVSAHPSAFWDTFNLKSEPAVQNLYGE